MNKKKSILISIDADLIPILKRVSKKHKRTMSGIIEDYLKTFLPILDMQNPKDVIKESFNLLGDGISDLFKDLEYKKND